MAVNFCRVKNVSWSLQLKLAAFARKILNKHIFALSFMISDKKRAVFAAWLVVKCFNYIYSFSETCVEKILEFLKNEIDFVLSNIKLGSKKLSCFHELRMEVDMQLQYLKYDL